MITLSRVVDEHDLGDGKVLRIISEIVEKEPKKKRKITGNTNDILGAWIADQCAIEPDLIASFRSLYESYSSFCGAVEPISKIQFSKFLNSQDGVAKRRSHSFEGEQGIFFHGISLKSYIRRSEQNHKN